MTIRPQSVLGFLLIVVVSACAASCDATPEPGQNTPDTADTRTADGASNGCEFYRNDSLGICVQCLEDSHCLSGHCEPNSFQCVACYNDSHCSRGVCLPDQFFCVECFDDSHCGSGTCDLEQKECVGCGSDSECDDSNGCTRDACIDGACEYTIREGQACDVDPCVDEVCGETGLCQSTGASTPGACVRECVTNGDCLNAERCQPQAGCEGLGMCVAVPIACMETGLVPVCGCDGETYKTECDANFVGVAVAYAGECACEGAGCCPTAPSCSKGVLVDVSGDGCVDTCCAPPPDCSLPLMDLNGDGCPETCPCDTDLDCPANTFCKAEACGEPGVCAECTGLALGALICTCDGTQESLKMACSGAVPWVVSPELGCCPEPPKCENSAPYDSNGDGCPDSCGCADTGCGDGQFCVPDGCGTQASSCVPCLADTGPVCGCDGVTYSSQCAAAKIGAAISYGGPCQCTPDSPCTGQDQVCDSPSCAADAVGQCVSVSVVGAVCGCDGITYSMVSAMKEVGVAFAYTGCCQLDCPVGTVGEDSDGDGCADVCIEGCNTAKDCVSNICLKATCNSVGTCLDSESSSDFICAGKCSCEGGLLLDSCSLDTFSGFTLDLSGAACQVGCPDLLCGGLTAGVDIDADGCVDTCVCDGLEPLCAPGEFAAVLNSTCDTVCLPVDCTGNEQCGIEHYCAVPTCGDSLGECVKKTAPCDLDSGPVCGCNGDIYPNACAAQAAGVSIKQGNLACLQSIP